MDITLVSSRAEPLEDALRGRLPEDVSLHCFNNDREVSSEALAAEVAIGAPDVLAPLLPRMPRLRWAQSTWAGVEPFLAGPRRDYTLTGVKGIFGVSMSEYVLGWLLALKRNIILRATESRWQEIPETGLSGLRIGIAGVGSIGSAVAERCAPFVSEVRGLNSSGRPAPGCARCYGFEQRLDFARGLDVLVLLLPATEATNRMADAKLLAQLAPGAVLINGGRANALDLPAALQALESAALSALVLDVFDREPLLDSDPLWHTPGVYISSHSAAPTSMQAIAGVFVDNLARYRSGQPLEGIIDFQRGY